MIDRIISPFSCYHQNKVIVAVARTLIPSANRVVRSGALSVRATDYVMAARALGGSEWRVVFIHVLPNCFAPYVIIATAKRLLNEIFKTGYRYHKCGVQLSHIQPESAPGQLDLFAFADNGLAAESRPLMKVVDQINRRFPKAISVAATGFDKSWQPTADRVSQHYTTDWRELVWVK